MRRVVVTGMGALTPIGLSVDAFWQAMMDGTSGAAPITAFDTERFDTKFACELKGFSAADFLDRKTARRLDRFSQLALVVALFLRPLRGQVLGQLSLLALEILVALGLLQGKALILALNQLVAFLFGLKRG